MSIDTASAEPPAFPPPATELLRAWWRASETERAEQLLTQLLTEHAIPTVKTVVNYRFRTAAAPHDEIEDLCQEISLQLIARLKYLKATGAPVLSGAFDSYVAAVAHQVCSLYRRRQFPAWARLKDQLRYVLTQQRGFALWETARKLWLAGFAAWREQQQPAVSANQVLDLQTHPEKLALPDAQAQALPLVELLTAIFKALQGPSEFTALIKLVAVIRGVKEAPASERALEEVAALRSSVDDLAVRLEQRLYLQRLWQEIVQLPLPQRRALLLNLRDAQERGLVVLLVELQITSLHQLAEVLALTPLEFAELWRELPLDDARVATFLGLTRQQVINLRSSARRQLANRLRAALGLK